MNILIYWTLLHRNYTFNCSRFLRPTLYLL